MLESIICNVIVDGLSRYGAQHVFDTSGEPAQWTLRSYNPRPDFRKRLLDSQTAFVQPDLPASEFNVIPVSMSISGFSYRAELATRLSLGVLLAHGIMAISHIVYVLLYPQTSRSWSSVSELIVLAQNSRPATDVLHNTGAGIKHSETYGQMAKIRVRAPSDNSATGRVELIFQKSEHLSHTRKGSQQSLVTLAPVDDDMEAQRGRSPPPPAQGIRRASPLAMWPAHASKLSVQIADETELDSRSDSVAPLVPAAIRAPAEVHIEDGENLRQVEVGKAYG